MALSAKKAMTRGKNRTIKGSAVLRKKKRKSSSVKKRK